MGASDQIGHRHCTLPDHINTGCLPSLYDTSWWWFALLIRRSVASIEVFPLFEPQQHVPKPRSYQEERVQRRALEHAIVEQPLQLHLAKGLQHDPSDDQLRGFQQRRWLRAEGHHCTHQQHTACQLRRQWRRPSRCRGRGRRRRGL